jgi:uncharacterized protein (TIGR02246 family)
MPTPRRAARAPQECDELLAEFLAAGDVDAILELYEKGACFLTQDRQQHVGHDAIRSAFADVAAGRPRLRCDILRTLRNGDNLAVLYNDWTMTITPPGGEPIEMLGKAVEVVCRQSDGTWRFAIDDPWARM